MNRICLIVMVVVLIGVAGSALGQLVFPDASEQNTAFEGAAGGGADNTASGSYATVGGGYSNFAGASYATVGGGYNNEAVLETGGTVGGGNGNTASGTYSTVGGGLNNTASGIYATLPGGRSNESSGEYATVPGGRDNVASGDYSFAAGRRAKATYTGSFILADSYNADVIAYNSNYMMARFQNGYVFYTNSGMTTGSWLPPGSGTWSSDSDRAMKENVRSVDSREVLDNLARIPIATWNYKTQDRSIRHMGPMAQDLHAAFGLGESDKHITTIDADGVALAAIQGLYQVVQEKDATITTQQAQIATQQDQISDLTERLAAVEKYIDSMTD